MPLAKTALNLSLSTCFGRDHGPWERRRYWLPEGFTVSTPQSLAAADSVRPWHRRTVQPQPIEIGRVAVARAAKDQLRKRARRLALRDAEVRRGLQRAAREGRLVVVYETPTIETMAEGAS